ncbi:uncharacterized protein HMPREF1541_01644 [Cyphellophora europaea CBS 101466]|uniref:Histone deacetylase domain-containing protein n=1 Tax=Cyphellophora europaea (strain CBS 101466) TaxID=1220924 RepID=W2S378_CYPE1|nr:uncharacterized protein HMPREF1541_01644 [Cyphellophora europaea CBS 101466]ETN42488.1 hypothetical protein HMPREF1541_01644 [Cyphellophora europaea CBS 101466]
MDPDIPHPSIEGAEPPHQSLSPVVTQVTNSAESTPRPPSTPLKSASRSPSRTQSPRIASRSPSVASVRHERTVSPALRTRQSLSNLSPSRSATPLKTQFRRASSNLNPASPSITPKSGAMPPETPKHKVLTPSMVATDYFAKELEDHATTPSKVVVITHDACYGHRYSRPRTSKVGLSMIVERPERILATVLGASTAYVRLGGRHAGSKYPPHPDKQAPSHTRPFQIRKTARSVPLTHACVTAVHGNKWMEELQIMCDTAESKLAMNGKELVRPVGYGKDEAGNTLPKLHEGDLYLCSESLAALQGCLGGVCDAIDTVFADQTTQRAFVCIRPPGHHCSSNYPSGFCWLNNVHVGISYAAMNHGLTHAAIIDFDLHHGDGSQTVTWDHNKDAQQRPKNAAPYRKTPIGYYSLHDINSYPCEWGDEDKVRNASLCIENAHGQSIWNVHLEPWANHAEFWKLYESRYIVLLDKARKFLRHHSDKLRSAKVKPRAAIFLSAGFDASEWEGAGMQRHGVNVPTNFYARFTSDVVKMAQEEDLGVDGRVISVLEGGYSDRALTSGVLSHICGLVEEPIARTSNNELPDAFKGGLGASMSGHRAVDTTANGAETIPTSTPETHSSAWWDIHSLESIEAIVAGNLPPQAKAKNDKGTGNYSSPTHASSAKMTETAKERRSLSAQLESRLALVEKPPPPPPDVEWPIAAYELSRLIIPTERQTLSCRHDELNAEATRARKERQSVFGVTAVPTGEPMQLRERKAKAAPLASGPSRSSSRTRSDNRRTTIASFGDLPDAKLAENNAQTGPDSRPRRRSSAASSIVSSFSEMKLGDNDQGGSEAQKTQGTAQTSARTVPATAGAGAGAKSMKPPPARKPRAAGPKTSVAPKAAPKKSSTGLPPLSRQGSNSSDKNTHPIRPTSSNQSRQVSGASDASTELDNITNGMKGISIKLNMPTEEQYLANKKKLEDTNQIKRQAKTTRKPPVPKGTKSKAPVKSTTPETKQQEASSQPPTQTAPYAQVTPSLADSEVFSEQGTVVPAQQLNESVNQPVPLSTPPTVPQPVSPQRSIGGSEQNILDSRPTMIPEAPLSNAHESMQENSDVSSESANPDTTKGQPDAAAWIPSQHSHPLVQTPAPNQWSFATPMPPESSSETASRPLTPNKKTKADLPIFTSTTPIPFSPRNNPVVKNDDTNQEVEGRSIWELPETPR